MTPTRMHLPVKKLLTPLVVGASYLLAVGCADLKETPISGITASYYATPAGFESAVNATYQPLRDWYRGLPNTLWQMRLLARVELHKHFSVFGGLTLNTLLQLEQDERVSPGLALKHHEATREGASTRVLYWPGFAFGVRL